MEALKIIKFKDHELKRNFINDLPYNPKLKEFARKLRKSRNLAEVLFWNEVKSKNFILWILIDKLLYIIILLIFTSKV